MCVGDWRLGSIIRSVPRSLSLTNAQTLTLGKNSERVGVAIMSNVQSGSNQLSITIDGVGTFSIGSSTAQTQYKATLQSDGDLPMRQWILTGASVAAYAGLLIEYFLPRNVIGAVLEEFKRQYPGVF